MNDESDIGLQRYKSVCDEYRIWSTFLAYFSTTDSFMRRIEPLNSFISLHVLNRKEIPWMNPAIFHEKKNLM